MKSIRPLLVFSAWLVASSASAAPGQFAATDYGAQCDGLTDDTAALLRARDAAVAWSHAGVVLLPPGNCIFKQTLVLGDTTTVTTSAIGIQGAGLGVSALLWRGPATETAIKLVRNKNFRLADFTLRNGLSGRGTTTGLLMTGYGGVGTETTGGVFDHVRISGFGIDLQAGVDGVAAASEIEYRSVVLNDANVGFLLDAGNSYNHTFTHLQLSENTTGVYATQGNLSVRGGASNGNGTDFDIRNFGFSVSDFRAELPSGGTFLNLVGGWTASVSNVIVAGSASAGTTSVRAWQSRVTIADSRFDSRIVINPWVHTLVMSNTFAPANGDLPVFWSRTTSDGESWLRLTNNTNRTTQQPFADVIGDIYH